MAKMICVRCGKREVAFLPNQEQLGGEPVLCQECGIENLLIQNKTLRADIEGVRKVAQEHINLKGAKDFSATHIAELLACHSTEVTKARQEPPKYYVGQLVWCLKSGTTFYRQMHRIDEIDKDGVMLESGSCYDAAYLRPVALRDKVITTGIGKYGSRIPKGIEASIYAFSSVGNDPTPFQLINANSWEWVEPEAVMLAEDEPTAEMPAEFYEGQWIWCTDNSLQDLTEGKCYKVEHIRIDGALEVRSDRGSLQDYLPCRSYFRPVCERDKVIWKGLAGILSAGTLFYFESANNPEKHYDINPTDLYLQDKI